MNLSSQYRRFLVSGWMLAACSLLIAQSDSDSKLSVVAVRHWSLPNATRVAIEVSGNFEFRTDRLHNPERVYFDILNSTPRLGPRRGYSENLDDAAVKRIRVAENTLSITRVVLDLGPGTEVSTSTLANPNRLMVEVRSRGSSTMSTAPSEPPVALLKAPVVPPLVLKPEPTIPKRPDPPAPPPKSVSQPAPAPIPADTVAAAPVITGPPLPEETAKAARRTSKNESSLIRALGLKINRVVLDPGHGGHDQGTESSKGVVEKELVLDVSQRLGKLIEDRMGAEVVFTRSDDTFIPLEGRTAMANERKADLFLSIHANSSPIPRIAGVETFYLNITGSKDAMDVAARENAASALSVFELQDIIRKITLHDKSTESEEFARRIQSSLYAFASHYIPTAKDRGVKSAPFVVLKDALMPSVLAEIGFLTNSREEALLKKPDYRDKLAEALYKGIFSYAQSLSHMQIAAKP